MTGGTYLFDGDKMKELKYLIMFRDGRKPMEFLFDSWVHMKSELDYCIQQYGPIDWMQRLY